MIHWFTPVDLTAPAEPILIHYGSPLATPGNTIIVPVKTSSTGAYKVQAINGRTGTLIWEQTSDYTLPPHSWTPSYAPTLTANRLYFPGNGGTVHYRDGVDGASGATGQLAFFGMANYSANPGAYNSTAFINTPITSDSAGNIYFGFRTSGTAPLGLVSGIARIDSNGNGTWVSAMNASGGDTNIIRVPHQTAPALSNNEQTLYVVVVSSTASTSRYLVGLDPTTLAIKESSPGVKMRVALKDPRNGSNASVSDNSSATPMVGPDGDVYYGVLANPSNGSRGWMLHFSGDLRQTKTPGAFGWDNTPSVVPASSVPSYVGSSSYLILTKYNNYAGLDGGDGVNKVAVLDPNDTMVEPHTSSNGLLVMKEILTIASPTPDEEYIDQFPNAVTEWCINTAAIDPFTNAALVNNEDGILYRWDFATNTLSESVPLSPGVGEAYTPSLIGPDGTVYAINQAVLSAVGSWPTISIDDLFVTEGNSGTSTAIFTVSLSSASSQPVSVTYSTSNGSAIAATDYSATSGTLSYTPFTTIFAPGETSKTIPVAINGDSSMEPDETFFVNVSNATNATIADGQGIATILDDDPIPSLSVNDLKVTEGNASTKNFTFTVTLSAKSSYAVTVDYATADGTASAGSDYVAKTGTLTFPAGSTSKTITVAVNGGTVPEADETFFLNLSNPTHAILLKSRGTGTILNDDAGVSINDQTVTEGDTGTANASFTVTLSTVMPVDVSVNYATANGSAPAATSGTDYVPTTGTLIIPAGSTTGTITVPVIGDTRDDAASETFFVNLTNPKNALISDTRGLGTISDDDANPSLSISDVTLAEGNGGTRNFIFTVSLSAASAQSITFGYSTADGTATAGSDYVAKTGTVTLAAGVTTSTITVVANGDATNEPDETYLVNLNSPTNATIADGQAIGTILSDDPYPVISINDVKVTEGNAGTKNFSFTASLSVPSTQVVTVQYATANGTGTAGSDYVATSGTITFNPGVLTRAVTVVVNQDTAIESDETFFVNLTNPTNATIADAQAQGTILNDDTNLQIHDVTIAEGDSGVTSAMFTVTLSGVMLVDVSVKYASANTSALAASAGTDYVATSGILTIPAGSTTGTITVLVIGDVRDEANERFVVNLSNPMNAIIADTQGLATITDNDATPTLSINDVTVAEGNVGTKTITFTVSLSAASGQSVTVNYATANDTALEGSDYVAKTGTLTFAAGVVTRSITIVVNSDTAVELDERLLVNLSNAINAVIDDGQALGVILNDDE